MSSDFSCDSSAIYCEARVGDVGAAQVQRFQLAVPAQKRHRRVGDELGGEEVQVFELIERFQPFGARGPTRRSATDPAASGS